MNGLEVSDRDLRFLIATCSALLAIAYMPWLPVPTGIEG